MALVFSRFCPPSSRPLVALEDHIVHPLVQPRAGFAQIAPLVRRHLAQSLLGLALVASRGQEQDVGDRLGVTHCLFPPLFSAGSTHAFKTTSLFCSTARRGKRSAPSREVNPSSH